MPRHLTFAHKLRQAWLGLTSSSSVDYWERRYRAGMSSGPGSYGELAEYKAGVLNAFVQQHAVKSVLEFGCGDGNQLSLARYPRYHGFDVSREAIETCIARFAGDSTKSFMWYDPKRTANLANLVRADAALSLDVIYHLLEDETYERYLQDLFSVADRYVIIYSSDRAEGRTAAHVRHRKFTVDVPRVAEDFRLISTVPNPYPEQTFADFFFYERVPPRLP